MCFTAIFFFTKGINLLVLVIDKHFFLWGWSLSFEYYFNEIPASEL